MSACVCAFVVVLCRNQLLNFEACWLYTFSYSFFCALIPLPASLCFSRVVCRNTFGYPLSLPWLAVLVLPAAAGRAAVSLATAPPPPKVPWPAPIPSSAACRRGPAQFPHWSTQGKAADPRGSACPPGEAVDKHAAHLFAHAVVAQCCARVPESQRLEPGLPPSLGAPGAQRRRPACLRESKRWDALVSHPAGPSRQLTAQSALQLPWARGAGQRSAPSSRRCRPCSSGTTAEPPQRSCTMSYSP
jgi:hypothetical protein